MTDNWLEQAKRKLDQAKDTPAQIVFDRLKAQGLVDDDGDVTGHLHRWKASRAIVNAHYSADRKHILHFRCLLPIFGMPGSATVDISRKNLIRDLESGKSVITAHWDDRLNIWREGPAVHLNSSGGIRVDDRDLSDDDVGDVAEFHRTSTA